MREATYEGVHDSDLIDFCLQKDRIAIVRPKLSQETRMLSIEASFSMLGKPYDFLFVEGDSSFYCSELIFWSYNSACRIDQIDFQMKKNEIMGVQTFLPDDFLVENEMLERLAIFP